jgi:hypothetical protein
VSDFDFIAVLRPTRPVARRLAAPDAFSHYVPKAYKWRRTALRRIDPQPAGCAHDRFSARP